MDSVLVLLTRNVRAISRAAVNTGVERSVFTGRPEVISFTDDPAFFEKLQRQVFANREINRPDLHHWSTAV